jgi:hypothetical protein
MLYLAQFSFSGKHTEEPLAGQEVSGHFNCLVEAEDVEEADRRLRALLRETKRKHEILDGATIVYLDSLIEVKSVPKKGMLTFFAEYFQEMPDTIFAAVPHTGPHYCVGYSFGESDDEDDEGEDAIAYLEFGSGETVAN